MRRRLREWEEVIGIPERVNNNLIIFKGLGEIEIDDRKILLKVKENIGKKIAILRTDIENKKYLMRMIECKEK
jgi:hypothetical protein